MRSIEVPECKSEESRLSDPQSDTSLGLYKPTVMWLGSTVFLVGGQTGSGGDSNLLEANMEFYVLRPSGAFEPYRDWME